MAFQKFCYSLPILHMLRHAYMQGLQSKIQDESTVRGLHGTEITHKLSGTFRDECAFFSKFLSICNSVIALIWRAKSWISVFVRHPVKVTAINYSTA